MSSCCTNLDASSTLPTPLSIAEAPTNPVGNEVNVGTPSERERSHLMARLCEGCGHEFIPKRRWQRGCGSPGCRVAASRRRRAAELRTELERIAKALDSEDVQGARARLADLVSKLGTDRVLRTCLVHVERQPSGPPASRHTAA